MQLQLATITPPEPDQTVWESLTPSEQSRALDKYRYWDVDDIEWWDGSYEWFAEVAKVLGIEFDTYRSGQWKMHHSVPGSQSDSGFHFTGTYRHAPLARLLIRAEQSNQLALHSIADRLHEAQPQPYRVVVVVGHSGRHTSECGSTFEYECLDEDECDEDHTDEWNCPKPWAEDDFAEPLKDYMRWCAARLEDEYGCLTSDESVIERINDLDPDDVAELREEDDECF